MDPNTELEQRWFLTANLVTRTVGGQVFILMPDSRMHILENDSAVFLFNLLSGCTDGGKSLEELSGALLQTFEVSPERALADVKDFVRDLHALQVLSVSA